jgi:hypothetical protein
LDLTIGTPKLFQLTTVESVFKIPSLELFFLDELAQLYQPIIYAGQFALPAPEGMYYRILHDNSLGEYCIQYYVYWLQQNCGGSLPFGDHKYDYEPIFVYLKPPLQYPVGVVNGGYSKVWGLSCRFHKNEIRRREYTARDSTEYRWTYSTSPEPFYPFGGPQGRASESCIKRYPLPGAIYFDELRPLFGIVSCFNAFSGAEKDLFGPVLSAPLKRLTDDVLNEWYHKHHNEANEEPFGHDVSNPFDFPYIKYLNPRPYLQTQ